MDTGHEERAVRWLLVVGLGLFQGNGRAKALLRAGKAGEAGSSVPYGTAD